MMQKSPIMVFAAATICAGVTCSALEKSDVPGTGPAVERQITADTDDLILKYIFPVLRRSNKSGRLYYSSVCEKTDMSAPPIPPIGINLPPVGTGVSAIRRMLSGNGFVAVSEERSGIISIVIGNVPREILKTKITDISFDNNSRFNAKLSIIKIEKSPNIVAAMQNYGVSLSAKYIDMLLVLPNDRYPHLPLELRDIAFDQALDEVSTTFGGIVVYAACEPQHMFYTDFLGGYSFDRFTSRQENKP